MASDPIDGGMLQQLYGGLGRDGRDLASELMDTFLQETPPRLASLEAAVASGDSESTWRSAHALKGNSVTLAAIRLSELCRELETAARAQDMRHASDQVALILAEFARVRHVMEREREQVLAPLDL